LIFLGKNSKNDAILYLGYHFGSHFGQIIFTMK
jgi:hypothetical protein